MFGREKICPFTKVVCAKAEDMMTRNSRSAVKAKCHSDLDVLEIVYPEAEIKIALETTTCPLEIGQVVRDNRSFGRVISATSVEVRNQIC